MSFLVGFCRTCVCLSSVSVEVAFMGLDVQLVPHYRDLGWLVFFSRAAGEVFDRHSLDSKRGLVFVFVVVLAFKAEICTFVQTNSRI